MRPWYRTIKLSRAKCWDARTHEVSVHHRANTHWTGHGAPVASPQSEVLPARIQGKALFNDATDVIVAGSLAIDLSCDYVPAITPPASQQPQLHTSNPASIQQSLGGVGQNIATALHYLKTSVRLCSSVADDIAGSTALRMLADRGLQTSGLQKLTTGFRTAQYIAINDANRSLVLAMADMRILEDMDGDFDTLWKPQLEACKPKWLVIDANWNPAVLRKWIEVARDLGAKVAYEPVSVTKSRRIFSAKHPNLTAVPNNSISLATPNALELASLHEAATIAGLFEREDWWNAIDSIGLPSSGSRDKLVSMTSDALVDQGVPQQSIRLLPFFPSILTTLGQQGVLMTQMLRPGDSRLTSPNSAPYILSRSTDGSDVVGGVYIRLFPPVERLQNDHIVSVNGVGDTFLGIIIAGLVKEKPKGLEELVDVAQKGSVMTLKSKEAVSPQISSLHSAL